jgi:hypothetical protein
VLGGIGVVVAVVAAVLAAVLLLSNRSSDENGGGGTFPNATERRLLAAVPLITRTTCARIDYGDKAAVASVSCAGARLAVLYNLFPSKDTRDAWYSKKREEVGIEPMTGRCTAGTFHGEIDYGGGKAFCYLDHNQQPQMVWADEGSKVGAWSNVWKGSGKPAVESMLRQWHCCL